MPAYVGVLLAHACLQVLADDHGVDVLHIKGPAVDESLLDRQTVRDPDSREDVALVVPRNSVDADILVRPSHVPRLFEAMTQHGWRMVYDFADGSAFEHASTWQHDTLEHVDVHRRFPGIGLDPEAAFDVLWDQRAVMVLAGQSCPVPDITGQRLILILHAVRSGHRQHSDIDNAWTWASADERREVESLAARLRAEVALAAGTGRLEDYRGRREYALWKVLSTGDRSLPRLWLARVKAQPGPVSAIRMGLKLVLPNRNRMAQVLGRPPRAVDMGVEHLQRARTAIGEIGRLLHAAVNGRSGRSENR